MLLIDPDAALAAIPAMLLSDAETRLKAFELIKTVMSARGEITAEDTRRMAEVARLFGVDVESGATPSTVSAKQKGATGAGIVTMQRHSITTRAKK